MDEYEKDEISQELEDEHFSAVGNLMESRTSALDDLLLEKLEEVFHKQTAELHPHALAKIACEHSPVDLAHAAYRLPHYARYVLYDNLPTITSKVKFIVNADRTTRVVILRHEGNESIAKVIGEMPRDEAADFLDCVSKRRLAGLLDHLPDETAGQILDLLKHYEGSAGRLMTNELFAFPMHATIGQVAASIRDNPGVDLTRWIFVLGENQELLGFVPSRNLIVNSSRLPIKQVMKAVEHTVQPEASREEVIDLVERYKIPALPVVDQDGKLEGVITYEDVVEAMEDIADETFARIAGTSEEVGEHDPIYRRVMLRAPWLVFTVFAGLATATVMLLFQEEGWFFVVPFFVPLVTGMSGNVGIQCSTILVRGLATGEISSGTKGDAIAKEVVLGLSLGVLFGFGCGFVVYALNYLGVQELSGVSPYAAGSIITAGIFGACMTSTTLGVSFPFIFAKIGIDPAVAAGPIVTSLNDFLSSSMFILVVYMMSIAFGIT